jgi:hypothetical protein
VLERQRLVTTVEDSRMTAFSCFIFVLSVRVFRLFRSSASALKTNQEDTESTDNG